MASLNSSMCLLNSCLQVSACLSHFFSLFNLSLQSRRFTGKPFFHNSFYNLLFFLFHLKGVDFFVWSYLFVSEEVIRVTILPSGDAFTELPFQQMILRVFFEDVTEVV